ncbi:hypothetical protein SapgrDRAFT_3271 [Saprospira grandis DSM 2844]|uniref:Uncharacterized protein n=1 Tax=Saprospira grandis DSM 2844 TaxID=694433 RepID=J1I7W7_9BACT|nr:hypothetical protein SapgrDRAFT_3271 [Saprospira grandis DSM 2844]
MLGNLTLQDKVPNNFSVFIFLGPPQLCCGATFRSSQVCSALRQLRWLGLA